MGLFGNRKAKAAAECGTDYSALGLSPKCAELVKEGDELAAQGQTYDAMNAYFSAHLLDKYNLIIGRRFARLALGYTEDPTWPDASYNFLHGIYKHHVVEDLNGEDFELMARAIYTQIQIGNEAVIDKELAEYGFTTAGYLAKCIDDARYLGVDIPEFKEMEAAVAAGTGRVKESGFFNRSK